MKEITVPAPAKINLALKIKGLRSDGYHEVELIMQSISLHDRIRLRKNDGGIRLTTSDPSLPVGKKNLAYRAAEVILDYVNLPAAVDIHIEKRIPVAAGLAGGSTDAAAVLVGINKLFGLSLADEVLLELAAGLGSDVPFCLHGGTAFAYGRGEKIRQLPDIERLDLVIVNPGIPISTPWAYTQYDRSGKKSNLSVNKLLQIIEEDKEIDWQEGWGNDLEGIVLKEYKELPLIKERLKAMGAQFVLMSGSGSTFFAVVEDQKQGEEIRDNWPDKKDFVTIAWTVKKDFPELW